MKYDYSNETADRGSFDIIPSKTIVPVILAIQEGEEGTPENAMQKTKTGLYQLALEFTVTEGDFEKRKIWDRLTLGAAPGVDLTDGQKKAINISGSRIRAMLEAGRHFAPTDESDAAKKSRMMETIFELNGLEFWVEVGIEKGGAKEGGGTYDDKNKINKVLPYEPGRSRATQGQMQLGGGSAAPRQSAPATTTKKPNW